MLQYHVLLTLCMYAYRRKGLFVSICYPVGSDCLHKWTIFHTLYHGFDTTKAHFSYKSFDQTINPLLSTKRVLSR